MAFNVIEKRFKEYDGIKVYLEDEGIHLEFLKDKYVKYITVYLKRKYNYLPLEDIFAGARFYSDLAEELRKKDVECLSKKNTSYRSYRRMQNVLRGSKKPKNMEEMKKCVNFVKDMENLFDIKLLSNPEEKAL
ncbi:MAG: hypothetical protein IJB96_10180, partial [Lachnospira sp.]|nr:hypothetical protein [Lachnospira sp.]